MADRKRAKPPNHLSDAAKAWWRRILADYVLEEHHLRLLQVALEAWDRKEEARLILAEEGSIYHDRFGQPRKHPAVSIEEQARVQFLRALRELDLEGEPHPGYRR